MGGAWVFQRGCSVGTAAACGLRINRPNERQYVASIPSLPDTSVLFQRVADILLKVEEGSADIGITGYDVLQEHSEAGKHTIILYDNLGYGQCELVIAVPDCRNRWGGSQYLNSTAQGNYADYLADEISVADFALYPVVVTRKPVIEKHGGLPNLAKWADRMAARAGVELEPDDGRDTVGRVGFEWQPAVDSSPSLSVFADGEWGGDYDHVRAGLKIHFGVDGMSLIDRERTANHRELIGERRKVPSYAETREESLSLPK